MCRTKLILIEGIPGTGKSTLAHALLRQLRAQGRPARWWYEEDAAHPVYTVHDHAGLVRVVDDIAAGRYRRVIDDALAQWRRFAAAVSVADEVVILDGTLFGYLTWSLFPFLVPEREIGEYVAAVADILAELDPRLIYLRPEELAAAWRWLAGRRGAAWLQAAIERNARWPYGALHGLAGFAGLVAFWQAFQGLADAAFARLPFATLRLSAAVADHAHHLSAALAFLALPRVAEPDAALTDLARRAGRYAADDARLAITLQDGSLHIDGIPQFWPRNRLIPLPSGDFAVESFPHTLRFTGDPPTGCAIAGPALLSGTIPERWVAIETEASPRPAL